jgi:hypothetical protein
VTEQPILARFSLERVLAQLVARSGVAGATALGLFQQWWDTQNPGPGLGLGPHCDDEVLDGSGALNGYPYLCRPPPSEGGEAHADPFSDPDDNPGAYVPIGLFNRFDLAPGDGRHCGEHRIVYARRSGIADPNDRNLVIFEAVLPNPQPHRGLEGCRAIALAWANLSLIPRLDARADALERFYFEGTGLIPPVVDIAHFGDNAAGWGQIRTNQFMRASPRIWSLREFKLVRACGAEGCTAVTMLPATVKLNPFGPLFHPAAAHANAPAFQQHFVTQVAELAAPGLLAFGYVVPDVFNSGQSQATSSTAESNYVANLGEAPSAFRGAIEAALAPLGTDLTATDVVRRAQVLSCAGCHRLSNGAPLGGGLVWPPSLGFTHITERQTEIDADGVTRYVVSEALTTTLLPRRKQVLEDFLDGRPLPTRRPEDPIGGLRTH